MHRPSSPRKFIWSELARLEGAGSMAMRAGRPALLPLPASRAATLLALPMA
jgi:hypothetical protein